MTETHLVNVGGLNIRYADEGPKSAPVVMMSHSLSAELAMWAPQAEALQNRYRVVRYDTRGHGGTDAPDGAYTLDMLADDALGLMDALALDAVHWVGLSMGGMIGQTLALKAGARLRSLTLADTSSGYQAEAVAGWAERIAAAQANGLAGGVDATIDRWFSPGFVERDPATISTVRDMILATPVAGYCGCGAAIAKLNVTPRLGEIQMPTLVICGEDDPGTPLSMSEIMRDGIPGAKLAVLPVARHISNLEDVAGFNAALEGFLDAQSKA